MVRHNRLGLSWTIATVAFVACGDSTGPSEVSSVVVTPAAATVVSLGDTVQLTATAQDADGNTITGATFVWASSDPATAAVSDAGVVTAIASGTTTVTAANASQVLAARAYAAAQQQRPGQRLTDGWSARRSALPSGCRASPCLPAQPPKQVPHPRRQR